MKIRHERKSDIFHHATHNSNGTTKINRRNSGGSSRRARPKENMFAFNLCSTGLRSTSGVTSSERRFRFRKCIFRETESDSGRSVAAQSRTTSAARRPRSTRSSPSWKARTRVSGLAAPRIITSATRCRSYVRKAFCDCGVRIGDCGLIDNCASRSGEAGVRTWTGRFGSRVLQWRFCDCGRGGTQCEVVNMTTKELKERTFQFGVRVVRAVESLPKTEIPRTLGRQLLRAGTSIGANYRAAARARSQADFIAKLGIVEEECDEAMYWMEMIVELKLVRAARLVKLLVEANELLAIVVASIKTARRSRRA